MIGSALSLTLTIVGVWFGLCALLVLALWFGRPRKAGRITWWQTVRMGLYLLRKGGRP